MQDQLVESLQALVMLELAVGEFYKACAVRWPDDGRFWLEVARQEMDHAHACDYCAYSGPFCAAQSH
jgi:hypothetical protein